MIFTVADAERLCQAWASHGHTIHRLPDHPVTETRVEDGQLICRAPYARIYRHLESVATIHHEWAHMEETAHE